MILEQAQGVIDTYAFFDIETELLEGECGRAVGCTSRMHKKNKPAH